MTYGWWTVDGTLDRAKILGADTIRDIVNAALCETACAAERCQHVDGAALKRFAAATRDLADGDVMTTAYALIVVGFMLIHAVHVAVQAGAT